MSLGFARDSMLNLQQLAHDEEELEAEQAAAQGQKGIASAEDDGDEDGGGMFFDDATPEPPATSAMVPFPAAIATPAPSPERPAETKPPREQQPQNEQSEHEPPAQAAAQPKHEQKNTQYEGFTSDYAEYASYYATDPYGVGYGGYAAPQGGGPAKKNVFCCLFAPWNAEKVDSSEEESGHEQAEEKAPVAAVAPESVPKEVAYSAEEEEEKKAEDNSAGVVIEPPQGPTGRKRKGGSGTCCCHCRGRGSKGRGAGGRRQGHCSGAGADRPRSRSRGAEDGRKATAEGNFEEAHQHNAQVPLGGRLEARRRRGRRLD